MFVIIIDQSCILQHNFYLPAKDKEFLASVFTQPGEEIED